MRHTTVIIMIIMNLKFPKEKKVHRGKKMLVSEITMKISPAAKCVWHINFQFTLIFFAVPFTAVSIK